MQVFFDYDFMDFMDSVRKNNSMDPGEILNLLTNLTPLNNKVEQILLYSDQKFIYTHNSLMLVCSETVEQQVSDELQYLQEHKQIKIVLVCIKHFMCYAGAGSKQFTLCTLSKKWLQRNRLIEIDAGTVKGKSLNIFRQTFDLIRSL